MKCDKIPRHFPENFHISRIQHKHLAKYISIVNQFDVFVVSILENLLHLRLKIASQTKFLDFFPIFCQIFTFPRFDFQFADFPLILNYMYYTCSFPWCLATLIDQCFSIYICSAMNEFNENKELKVSCLL